MKDSNQPQVTTTYSVEIINQLRKEKKMELKASKEKIITIGHELFNPPESKNKMDSMMQHVNAGIAAYDGLMTGLKILRKVRGFFRRTKR